MSYVDESEDDDVPMLLNLGPSLEHHEVKEDSECGSTVVPVTILTGFLGSGKTTLIQHILRSEDHGKRIAIIENEFSGSAAAIGDQSGETAEREGLNIETLIARDGSNNKNLTDLIELPNGCICCTVKDSLVETLEMLLNKKKEIDYIIIECSGMANPGPIASIFWLDDALESRIRLDGIVTCVDARNLEMQLLETASNTKKNILLDSAKVPENVVIGGDEAAQQIAYADRIIVNKIDLLDVEKDKSIAKLERVVQQIRAINATAPIVKTKYSEVSDINWILDANCFNIEKAKGVETAFHLIDKNEDIQQSITRGTCSDSNCFPCLQKSGDMMNGLYCGPCQPDKPNHIHTNAITTIALINKGSVDLRQMNTWLASILWPDQDKDDKILKAQLDELERLNEITTSELTEQRRNNELTNMMHVFRIKGILSIGKHGSDTETTDDTEILDGRKYIVQAVNDLWEIQPSNNSESWRDNDERKCKLVIIGRNLNSEQLLSGFHSCFINF
jgi:G3E family GTPase